MIRKIFRVLGASLVVFLAVLSVCRVHIPDASAEVSITLLSPSEGLVGAIVTLTGYITTENGSYKVFFAEKEVESGIADLHDVSKAFVIPNSTAGENLVKLHDVETGENSTLKFQVNTEYQIKALTPPYPQQLQEGENVTILVIMTGGNATTLANITVTDPSNVTHSVINSSIPLNADGYGETSMIYPTDFGNDAHTYFAGNYNLSVASQNETLATGNFTIGLTDATEYHRFQIASIQAANYTSTDLLEITITHEDWTVDLAPDNASGPHGIITISWMVPANASTGLYEVDIAPTKPLVFEKPIEDSQNFTVTAKSFSCEVRTVNWDNEPVEGVLVDAKNLTAAEIISQETTDDGGRAYFYLEATNYTFKAFSNVSDGPRAEVGETEWISLGSPPGNLTGDNAINITCSLAHIKVMVEDEEGRAVPFAEIQLNFTYMSRLNKEITPLPVSSETSINGSALFQNMPLNISYLVEAKRYGQTFSSETINLTSTTSLNITCPNYELTVTVFDVFGQPIHDAQIRIFEWSIGSSGSGRTGDTGSDGVLTLNLKFGKYVVEVYKEGALLNKTSTFLTEQPTTFEILCNLYNLSIDITVVDYFGQRIANVNITLERDGTLVSSSKTETGGNAVFSGLIGGNYKVLVYHGQRPYESTTLYLSEPKAITLKLAGTVSIAGFLIETSHLASIVSVAAIFLALLFALLCLNLKWKGEEE
ncbi:MAG: carboxypeptidase regulatory-like domain-containing protein [Candidatus Bathyarchaeota archaeon]|nr:MAG: carboxypeptidase regulatory-like domain-containing protein [Candidatus Bathyarchaeota archaeon]